MKNETTKEGFKKMTGVIITSTGVYEYRNNDKIEYQFKPKEEIFKESCLESGVGKPITDGHPLKSLNSSNVKEHIIGTIIKIYSKENDDKNLYADLIIIDKKAIDKIKNKKINELSLGYSLILENEEGEFEGKKYNKRQKDIQINHLAIVKKSRIGKITSINMDVAKNNQTQEDNCKSANMNENYFKFTANEIENEFQKIQQENNNTKNQEYKENKKNIFKNKIENKTLEYQKAIENKNKILESKNQEIQNNLMKIKELEQRKQDLENQLKIETSKLEDVVEQKFFQNITEINNKLNFNLKLDENIFDIYQEFKIKLNENYNIVIDNWNENDFNNKIYPTLNLSEILDKYKNYLNNKKENKKKSISLVSKYIEEYSETKLDPVKSFNEINFKLSSKKQNF